ncbi:arsinothricin resistance N-acetyltransferase ArsN1 family A [Paenibacillus beijingensis]|uniref:GCN5 family acetyltransferase n=1 Tax=Paenibacillus beijingensis TaxID=1126833 RepID=A0A0D5NQ29_9BACL|nr:arsinothricin resistance N-acetyltransferase ArsN1 family A [Paenibacillus beijingensis]AJY77361.1 GCN5 family acetyltransferase [Paenibacillus beijingensis]
MNILIKKAKLEDAEAITEIYNQGIDERASTFETKQKIVEEITDGIKGQGERFPILTAHSEHNHLIGWASISSYSPRDVYKGVGVFSIYIRRGYRGKGIGKKLLQALTEEAERIGYWKLTSRILEFNAASRSLCISCGYREVGIYEKHSKLEGKWIDCVVVEKIIQKNIN